MKGEELKRIASVIQHLGGSPLTPEQANCMSVLNDIKVKLLKRWSTISASGTEEKKTTLKLKYHEGFMLLKCIHALEQSEDDWEAMVLRKMAYELDKQLLV